MENDRRCGSRNEDKPVSRTWHDRLLGAATGIALTLATLWLILVSAATATVILRT